MPPDSKPKNRPQQSCLKCRERKIKCDRSIPCNACLSRGLEAECTYLTTPEDRAHISQAEIIERLRREVAQLRTQLTQTPRGPSPNRNPNRSRNWAPYARPQHSKSSSPDTLHGGSGVPAHNAAVAAATGLASAAGVGPASADLREGSWSASSPSSSSTMTNPRTVASPESTGSDSGVTGMSQAVYPGTGFIANNQNMMSDIAISHCQPAEMAAMAPNEIPTSIPLQAMQMPYAHHAQPQQYIMTEAATMAPYMNNDPSTYDHQTHQQYMNITNDYDPTRAYNPQWGAEQQFTAMAPAIPESSYFSSVSPPSSTGMGKKSPSTDVQNASQPQLLSNQNSRSSISHMAQSTLSPWKGEGKQELLETLFKTIGSCNEESVAQVVQVVRSSATPEDAVSGICQVLGIGNGNGA